MVRRLMTVFALFAPVGLVGQAAAQEDSPRPLTVYFNGYVRGNFGLCT